jgi:hypothetical protein
MTFKDFNKLISMGQKQAVTTQAKSRLTLLSQRLRNKPFWIWSSIEKHKQEYKRTNGDCCFNHIIGLPQKDGVSKPMFDYEQLIHDCLFANNNTINNQKCLWIKKATGLGVTEFFLRFMVWLCLKDSRLSGTQMIIVTGPNQDIAINKTNELDQPHFSDDNYLITPCQSISLICVKHLYFIFQQTVFQQSLIYMVESLCQ